MTASKGKRPQRWAGIHADLRSRILSCQLLPGTAVSESALAQEYGSSPTPVRDALARLRQEGLILTGPGRGYRVAPLSLGDVRELAEARSVLEAGIVGLVVEVATDAELDALSILARVNQGPVPLTESQLISLNREFHLQIAKLTHNSRLVALQARVLDDSERVFHIGIAALPAAQLEADHMALADALRARDVNRAILLSKRESLETSRRVLQTLLGTRDERTSQHLSVMSERA